MDAQHTAPEFGGDFPTIDARVTDEASPFVTMWLHPRRTMRHVVGSGWETWAIPIAITAVAAAYLYGWLQLGDAAGGVPTGMTGSGGVLTPLFTAVIIGTLMGTLGVIILGWCIHLTGRWLGGEAGGRAVRTAIGWSYLPQAAMLPLAVLVLLLHGPAVGYPQTGPVEGGGSILLALSGLAVLVTYIWFLVLLIASVREVQGFSITRAIVNVFLASILPGLLLLPLILAAILIPVLAGGGF